MLCCVGQEGVEQHEYLLWPPHRGAANVGRALRELCLPELEMGWLGSLGVQKSTCRESGVEGLK